MSEEIRIEVLDKTPNACVVKLPFRNFPGLVLQGDSLKILHNLAVKIIDIDKYPDENVEDLSTELYDLLNLYLLHYEKVMYKYGLELPYVKRPSE